MNKLSLLSIAFLFNGMAYAQQNVGIGTPTPVLKLEVVGLNVAAATSGSAANGIARFQPAGSSIMLDIGSSGTTLAHSWIQSRDNANYATNYNLAINPNGGNVGIGTTTPGANLEVNAAPFTAAFQSRVALRLNAGNFGGFTRNALNIEFANSSTAVIGAEVPAAGGMYDLVFSNYSASTNFTEKMRITGNGNVGIGTATRPHLHSWM